MKFENIGIENEELMSIAAKIANKRAGRGGPRAHKITLEAIREEIRTGTCYVLGSLDGVPCVVGSHDIVLDVACRPDYRQYHAVEIMLEYLEDELSKLGKDVLVVVADPDIKDERHLVGILRRYGYSRSDSLGHPHENGQFMARSMAVLA